MWLGMRPRHSVANCMIVFLRLSNDASANGEYNTLQFTNYTLFPLIGVALG